MLLLFYLCAKADLSDAVPEIKSHIGYTIYIHFTTELYRAGIKIAFGISSIMYVECYLTGFLLLAFDRLRWEMKKIKENAIKGDCRFHDEIKDVNKHFAYFKKRMSKTFNGVGFY